MANSGSRNDPFTAFNFLVEIDGVVVAGFTEVSGLSTESGVIEYRNGDEDITPRKLPGLRKFSNITLKRGLTSGRELWEWRKTVMDGQTERQSGTITLLNEAREEVMRWVFRAGWPAKWDGPTLNALADSVAIETLEIACEHLEMVV